VVAGPNFLVPFLTFRSVIPDNGGKNLCSQNNEFDDRSGFHSLTLFVELRTSRAPSRSFRVPGQRRRTRLLRECRLSRWSRTRPREKCSGYNAGIGFKFGSRPFSKNRRNAVTLSVLITDRLWIFDTGGFPSFRIP
jgi:hypothetical protein